MPKLSLKTVTAHLHRKGPSGPQQAALGVGANRQPFDLTKMRYETERRRKRRQLLLWSLPVVVIVFLIALWFLLPTPLNHKSIANYKSKNFHSSRSWLTPLTWTSPQPFVIDFNSGTVDTSLTNYDRAEVELTKALALATSAQRCMVLQNLAFSLDAHAASLVGQGKGEAASGYSTEAGNIKSGNVKCFRQPKAPPYGGGGGGGAQNQNQQILTPAQAQQLQQKNQQGQASQQQDFQQNTLDPNSPNVKPW